MASLVNILARELKEWPEGIGVMAQWPAGEVAEPMGVGIEARAVYVSCWIADDADDAVVTRAQWQAERDRIAANQQATKEAREIASGFFTEADIKAAFEAGAAEYVDKLKGLK